MQEKIRRAGTGSQVLTLVFGMWLTAGMFLERWENSRAAAGEADRLAGGGGTELLLYSGLAASILWLGWFMVRGKLLHGSWKSGLPDGYGAGLAGAGLFLLGSLGGLLWQLAGELQPGGIEEHYSPNPAAADCRSRAARNLPVPGGMAAARPCSPGGGSCGRGCCHWLSALRSPHSLSALTGC
ncbi:hypothetical protein [Paenibacillus mucilaginosus]|uniref:hypothetical protein n=1 Tax=Paenibacillus mucilaginosus TaxID=61624 RepID=UPI000310C251|nr:hypothetical protein [Paenibacillus mucilaginosus]